MSYSGYRLYYFILHKIYNRAYMCCHVERSRSTAWVCTAYELFVVSFRIAMTCFKWHFRISYLKDETRWRIQRKINMGSIWLQHKSWRLTSVSTYAGYVSRMKESIREWHASLAIDSSWLGEPSSRLINPAPSVQSFGLAHKKQTTCHPSQKKGKTHTVGLPSNDISVC